MIKYHYFYYYVSGCKDRKLNVSIYAKLVQLIVKYNYNLVIL